MKRLLSLILPTIVAVWILVIAIVAMQNAEPVAIKFLVFESVSVPMGFVFAATVALGMMGTAILQPLFALTGTRRPRSTQRFTESEF